MRRSRSEERWRCKRKEQLSGSEGKAFLDGLAFTTPSHHLILIIICPIWPSHSERQPLRQLQLLQHQAASPLATPPTTTQPKQSQPFPLANHHPRRRLLHLLLKVHNNSPVQEASALVSLLNSNSRIPRNRQEIQASASEHQQQQPLLLLPIPNNNQLLDSPLALQITIISNSSSNKQRRRIPSANLNSD